MLNTRSITLPKKSGLLGLYRLHKLIGTLWVILTLMKKAHQGSSAPVGWVIFFPSLCVFLVVVCKFAKAFSTLCSPRRIVWPAPSRACS
jgi:hypothetical protein